MNLKNIILIMIVLDIVVAVKMGIKKLNRYYLKTDDTTMYTVTTGKLIIN